MHRIIAAILAIGTVTVIAAQREPPTLRGRVIDATTKYPVANARVWMQTREVVPHIALTDRNGAFILDVPDGEPRVVRVRKAGYAPHGETVPNGSDGVTIALLAGAAISGIALDAFGEPVRGAQVTAEAVDTRTASARSAITNDRGEYRVGTLAPGAYRVHFSAFGAPTLMRAGPSSVITGSAPIDSYYPGTTVPERAEVIRLTAGDERNVDGVLPGALPPSPLATLAGPPRPSGGSDTGSIRGVVHDTAGHPIANVFVRAFAREAPLLPAIRSAADGTFLMSDLTPGRYVVMAAKNGYALESAPSADPTAIPGVTVDVEARHVQETTVALERLGAITGRVLDEYGDPVDGVVVQPMQVRYDMGRRRLLGLGISARTDDRGTYRLHSLRAGRYYITGRTADATQPDTGYGRTFFGGGSDPGGAQAVSINAGAEVAAVDLQLERTPTAVVSGRVIDRAGQASMGGQLTLMPIAGADALIGQAQSATITPDGQFAFSGVTPGTYAVRSYAGRRNAWTEGDFATARITVADADVAKVVLQVTSGSSVRGRLVFDARGAARPSSGDIEIAPVPVEPESAPSSIASLRVNADWTIEMEGITGVRRLLPARMPTGWSLRDIRAGGLSMLDTPLDFSRLAGSNLDLEIVLSDRVTEVRGRVRDSRNSGVGGQRVVVFSTDRTRWYDRSRFVAATTTDASGFFSFSGMPFDAYYVAVMTESLDGDAQAWRDASLLEMLARRASTVVLREGQPQLLELRSEG